MDAAIIDLREQYGVFRQNTRVVRMGSDTLTIPRRASGLTGYFVGEAASITESTGTFDQVSLIREKICRPDPLCRAS